jgi:hypothetical protein
VCCCIHRIAVTLSSNCNSIITVQYFYCPEFPHGILYLIGLSRYIVQSSLTVLQSQSTAVSSDSLFSPGNRIIYILNSASMQSHYGSVYNESCSDGTVKCTGQRAFEDIF